MRLTTLILALLLAAIQVPLWLGKGGWLRVAELQRQLDDQRAANDVSRGRNGALGAELASLSGGREAIEERARHELHMARPDEMFFQWVDPAGRPSTAATRTPVAPAAYPGTGR
jgi:cell division protein FtsB